jgi:hypothetical protein
LRRRGGNAEECADCEIWPVGVLKSRMAV